jgi:hypothetical protein
LLSCSPPHKYAVDKLGQLKNINNSINMCNMRFNRYYEEDDDDTDDRATEQLLWEK